MQNSICVVLCHCNGNLLPESGLHRMREQIRGLAADLYEVKDLCAVVLNEKHLLDEITAKYRNKIMVACYPRAVRNILEQGGIDAGSFNIINFREKSPEQITEDIKSNFSLDTPEPEYHRYESGLDVPAWYPVVDHSRCSLCGKCADFCLFGVYKYDGKSLRVAKPLSCKNNCPACGRLCPESAIIFPKWKMNSVLSGADPDKKPDKGTEYDQIDQLVERNRKRKMVFKKDFIDRIKESSHNDADSTTGKMKT